MGKGTCTRHQRKILLLLLVYWQTIKPKLKVYAATYCLGIMTYYLTYILLIKLVSFRNFNSSF